MWCIAGTNKVGHGGGGCGDTERGVGWTQVFPGGRIRFELQHSAQSVGAELTCTGPVCS